MTLRLGYLLPTRERIMAGIHETRQILNLADHAETIGIDSLWIGDSLLAKPRHEPLTLLSALSGRTKKIKLGTAVLLPMLRNPVLLAHQIATIDQISEGRLIVGIGTARDVPAIRNEFQAAGVAFEKRIGTMLEQIKLCRSLWSGDEINWEGRWIVNQAELAPKPYTPGGPPIWSGGGVTAALKRTAQYFDGWFPSGPGDGQEWGKAWALLKKYTQEAGRHQNEIIGAAYVTLAINEDRNKADEELNLYLKNYYKLPAQQIRDQQYCFSGERNAAIEWLNLFVQAGATHICVRFTGNKDEQQMEELAKMREQW